jgi:hypothetical protein
MRSAQMKERDAFIKLVTHRKADATTRDSST